MNQPLRVLPAVKPKIWGHEDWYVPRLTEKPSAEILGKRAYERYGETFPILLKTITTTDILSVQVHPNDAQAQPLHSWGKFEMWYVTDAQPDSTLLLGFKQSTTPERCRVQIANGTLQNSLNEIPVKEGDAFLIEPGTVHALGKNISVVEIQEPSDITYRLYDFHRKDAEGHERELHIDAGLEVCDYHALVHPRLTYNHTLPDVSFIQDEHFIVRRLLVTKEPITRTFTDTFSMYLCTKGVVQVENKLLHPNECLFIPASIHNVSVKSFSDTATIIEMCL